MAAKLTKQKEEYHRSRYLRVYLFVEGRGSRFLFRGSRVEGIFYKHLCYSEKDN